MPPRGLALAGRELLAPIVSGLPPQAD